MQHGFFQIFLVIGEQGVNLMMSFIADGVNLRGKVLAGRFGISVEQGLNFIVVLLKERTDLLLLLRSQLQVFGELRELLIDGLRRVDTLQLLTR